MTSIQLSVWLNGVGACAEARAWARLMDPRAAWEECPRADWLIWLCARVGVDRAKIARAVAACVRQVLPIWERRFPEDGRPRGAVEALEAWAEGRLGPDEVRSAVEASLDAANEAEVKAAQTCGSSTRRWYELDAANEAEVKAARVVDAALAAADAASFAVFPAGHEAAGAASRAFVYTASAVARGWGGEGERLKEYASIVREHVPYDELLRIWEGVE